jgi:Tfp pilus assembly protein PilV
MSGDGSVTLRGSRKGLALIEVLIAVVLVGMLCAIVLAALTA